MYVTSFVVCYNSFVFLYNNNNNDDDDDDDDDTVLNKYLYIKIII
jgi:hypothetical protein